jgi:hypothetical protein
VAVGSRDEQDATVEAFVAEHAAGARRRAGRRSHTLPVVNREQRTAFWRRSSAASATGPGWSSTDAGPGCRPGPRAASSVRPFSMVFLRICSSRARKSSARW